MLACLRPRKAVTACEARKGFGGQGKERKRERQNERKRELKIPLHWSGIEILDKDLNWELVVARAREVRVGGERSDMMIRVIDECAGDGQVEEED
jgi:hypothetical protein